MKCVILAGGLGTRISEESTVRPKPMIEIGGWPIIWHIMKAYSVHGVREFIICLGYKGYVIKEYFANYALHMADVTIDLAEGHTEIHERKSEPWRITLVDTGETTQTGGRLRRIDKYVGDDDFYLTYGDGVSDVHIGNLLAFHREQGALVTVTAVQPPGRFGALMLDGSRVQRFREKPEGDGGWINGGFFVLNRSALSYIEDDQSVWEGRPLERLAVEGNVAAYLHKGFWHAMDTLRDKTYLEHLWASGQPPWKTW